MRFRIDGRQNDGRSGSRPGATILDARQREAFLKLLLEGVGRISACAQLGIGVPSLQLTLRDHPSFRVAVATVERLIAEQLRASLYQSALDGDTEAAIYLLDRHDRRAEARRERRGRAH